MERREEVRNGVNGRREWGWVKAAGKIEGGIGYGGMG